MPGYRTGESDKYYGVVSMSKIILDEDTSDHLRKLAKSLDTTPENLVKMWCIAADEWTGPESICKT